MRFVLFFIMLFTSTVFGQRVSDRVNVFLGTSGDYGQMSPGASYPFSMLVISPSTYPYNHTGYEHKAEKFNGVTHTLLQGVGCKGNGGNILIKPIVDQNIQTQLYKNKEEASPGYYQVEYKNGIKSKFTVGQNVGFHQYEFPDKAQLFVDLSYAIQDGFVDGHVTKKQDGLQGKISSKTTCGAGVYHFYFDIDFGKDAQIKQIAEYQFIVSYSRNTASLQVGISSVDVSYANQRINQDLSFNQLLEQAKDKWDSLLSVVDIKQGQNKDMDLFYSLLYRTMQSPFLISEPNGFYRTIDGQVKKSDFNVYNGWAIWDNYREIFPLFSILYPQIYKDMVLSVANLYPYGKKDFSTLYEPSPTVRTEHSLVVLADGLNKGVALDIDSLKPYLMQEADSLDYSTADKALESSYDLWALAQIFENAEDYKLADSYYRRALDYKEYWQNDFKDIQKQDVDKMGARKMYQGTIWQYRWLVPYDIAGLQQLIGSTRDFEKQLDMFFLGDYYNHANQPDLQTSSLYYTTKSPYKSQKLIHQLLLGNTIQFYFNDNSKGIDPYIGRIYKNEPQAFLRTMDDDLGTMSAWFVLRSLGFSPANVGSDVFYLTAPIFQEVLINPSLDTSIKLSNKNGLFYINQVSLNGYIYPKSYVHYNQLLEGIHLDFKTQENPNFNWPIDEPYISKINNHEKKI